MGQKLKSIFNVIKMHISIVVVYGFASSFAAIQENQWNDLILIGGLWLVLIIYAFGTFIHNRQFDRNLKLTYIYYVAATLDICCFRLIELNLKVGYLCFILSIGYVNFIGVLFVLSCTMFVDDSNDIQFIKECDSLRNKGLKFILDYEESKLFTLIVQDTLQPSNEHSLNVTLCSADYVSYWKSSAWRIHIKRLSLVTSKVRHLTTFHITCNLKHRRVLLDAILIKEKFYILYHEDVSTSNPPLISVKILELILLKNSYTTDYIICGDYSLEAPTCLISNWANLEGCILSVLNDNLFKLVLLYEQNELDSSKAKIYLITYSKSSEFTMKITMELEMEFAKRGSAFQPVTQKDRIYYEQNKMWITHRQIDQQFHFFTLGYGLLINLYNSVFECCQGYTTLLPSEYFYIVGYYAKAVMRVCHQADSLKLICSNVIYSRLKKRRLSFEMLVRLGVLNNLIEELCPKKKWFRNFLNSITHFSFYEYFHSKQGKFALLMFSITFILDFALGCFFKIVKV